MTHHIPDGYKMNASGHLVPLAKIPEIDLLKDDLVKNTIAQAKVLKQTMQTFKHAVLEDITAFIELSAERFNVQIGGKKGNVSLLSFDGKLKVEIAVQQHIAFDENVHAAKAIIDECLHRWTANADDNIKALIEHAFRVDSQGNIRTVAVLNLFKLKITDPRWLQAMDALRASLTPVGSKSYVRFYERGGHEEAFAQINLDISSL